MKRPSEFIIYLLISIIIVTSSVILDISLSFGMKNIFLILALSAVFVAGIFIFRKASIIFSVTTVATLALFATIFLSDFERVFLIFQATNIEDKYCAQRHAGEVCWSVESFDRNRAIIVYPRDHSQGLGGASNNTSLCRQELSGMRDDPCSFSNAEVKRLNSDSNLMYLHNE